MADVSDVYEKIQKGASPHKAITEAVGGQVNEAGPARSLGLPHNPVTWHGLNQIEVQDLKDQKAKKAGEESIRELGPQDQSDWGVFTARVEGQRGTFRGVEILADPNYDFAKIYYGKSTKPDEFKVRGSTAQNLAKKALDKMIERYRG